MKKFGLGLLAAFFFFSVIAVAVSSAANSVFGSPDTLKESLAESTVYDSAADSIVDQAVKSMEEKPEGRQQKDDLQLNPKTVEKVATRVVTPEKLQGYANQIVDGTYNWLEGETEQPDYNLDVSTIKKDIGNSLGDVAVERVEGLPACTTAQLTKLQARGNDFDPFTIPCRPPGINLKAERAKLVNEVIKSDELLEDTKITPEDTKSEETGQTPFQNLAFVPALFQLSQIMPWLLGVLGIFAGAGLVLLSEDRRKGIKKVAVILLVSGLLLLIGIWIVNLLFGSIKFDGTPDDQMRETLVGLVRTLNAEFNNTLRIFAVIYTVLGAGGLLGLHFTNPKSASANKPDVPGEKPPEPKTDSDVPPKK